MDEWAAAAVKASKRSGRASGGPGKGPPREDGPDVFEQGVSADDAGAKVPPLVRLAAEAVDVRFDGMVEAVV